MNLLIAGDTVPTENNIELFTNEQLEEILGDKLLNFWEKADYKVFNLEAPITNSNNKIKKCGPNLKIDPKAIKGIKKMNPSLVLLANNHIMDYGYEGLKDTLDILNRDNIEYIGVGQNTKKLNKSYIMQCEDKKIAIYNCCETEFSIATDERPGANAVNLLELEDDIKNLKEKNEYVIVIYHGGREHCRYPSPNLQKLCRKIVDWGADLITCQHSHCIGCYENYKKKTIVYGQGNFIFDMGDNEISDASLILNIKISQKFEVDYIPIIKTEKGIKLCENKEKKQILESFQDRSKKIKDTSFLEEKYEHIAKKYYEDYLQKCHGNNIFYKVLNKLCCHKLIKKLYSKESLLALLNTIEAESHRELFIKGLREMIYEEDR